MAAAALANDSARVCGKRRRDASGAWENADVTAGRTEPRCAAHDLKLVDAAPGPERGLYNVSAQLDLVKSGDRNGRESNCQTHRSGPAIEVYFKARLTRGNESYDLKRAQMRLLTASQKTVSHSHASLRATNDLRYSRGARVEVQAEVLRRLAALDFSRGETRALPAASPSSLPTAEPVPLI
jgi:hypothetical protein